MSDYLPAPHGLTGFAAPVEQVYPALTSFVELEDGRTIVTTDGADTIEPSSDGRTLRVGWNRWALVGAKPGEFVDVGLSSSVTWALTDNMLVREETLTTKQPLAIRRWCLAVPTSFGKAETTWSDKIRTDRFTSDEGTLEVSLRTSFAVKTTLIATGNSPLGRGVRGAIPLHTVFESSVLRLKAGDQLKSHLSLSVTERPELGTNSAKH